ncbi:hypothetical protein PR048_005622 [Dryococelus australis]|uniref:Uncharacterized protein n=1 Tax=Dryococelus australis TaxID=614101 RepID=A0ABQ9I8V7_9NEOP|nr:hypothetical protein PR048_005622 [Dryococelus australis]
MMSYFTDRNQRDWDDWLYVLLAYRCTPHSATGESPFFLLHGQDPLLPFNDMENHEGLLLRLQTSFEVVQNSLQANPERAEFYFNKHAKGIDFFIGDRVFLKNEQIPRGLNRKFYRKWLGPY